MKRLLKWVVIVGVILGGAFLLLRTPDSDPAAMKAKYGRAPSQFVDLGGGLTVHLRDEGPRDAPVLVLLHGSNADLHTWDAWTRMLSGKFRIIRYDQIGHGLTGPNPAGGHSPAAMVDVLERLRTKLGLDRFALAGNSMGGGLAARYASTYPQHVAALILVDAGGAPRQAGAGRGNIGAWHRGNPMQRVYLPGSGAAGLEHAVTLAKAAKIISFFIVDTSCVRAADHSANSIRDPCWRC